MNRKLTRSKTSKFCLICKHLLWIQHILLGSSIDLDHPSTWVNQSQRIFQFIHLEEIPIYPPWSMFQFILLDNISIYISSTWGYIVSLMKGYFVYFDTLHRKPSLTSFLVTQGQNTWLALDRCNKQTDGNWTNIYCNVKVLEYQLI